MTSFCSPESIGFLVIFGGEHKLSICLNLLVLEARFGENSSNQNIGPDKRVYSWRRGRGLTFFQYINYYGRVWGGWPGGWRCCKIIWRFPNSTSLQSSWWPSGHKLIKNQWLTSSEWGCLLNSSKLTLEQPNSMKQE